MKNKLKNSLKRTFILFYLIFLIIIVFFSSFITFLLSIDNSFTPTINKSDKFYKLNIIDETPPKIDFSAWNKLCDWQLIVINSDNEVPSNFKTKLKNYKDIEIDERIIPDLDEMINAAAYKNISIYVSSGYRNFEEQNTLFEKKISENVQKSYSLADATTLAQSIVSKPGTSEHHAGLAIDLNGAGEDFCYTDAYNWLVENSYRYGFILRYKSQNQNITGTTFKPWHFRYVGKLHAKAIEEKCMCLEEYVSSLMPQQ